MSGERTIQVYIDGFNLYRRALVDTPYKWLDIAALAQLMLPAFEVTRVKYFTALVKSSAHDNYVRQRQERYLEAIRCDSLVEVHLGYFRRDPVSMPKHPWTYDEYGKPETVKVKHTREKGSDVNLATHLVWDALHQASSAYAVLTNDSDLVTPIRMLRELREVEVGVLFPSEITAKDLRDCGSWSRHIHKSALARSQLPNPVTDDHGNEIWRPIEWPGKKRDPGFLRGPDPDT